MEKPTLLTSLVIPSLAAMITGLLAGLLVQALGGNGLAIGLGVALAAWIFRPGALPSLPAVQLPQAKEQTVKLHLVTDQGKSGDFVSLAIDQDRLQNFASGLVTGRALACREWTGKGALFSQSEFARLRSELISRGLARWISDRDPRGGCVLTGKGLATMRGLAALPTTPPDQTISKSGDIKKTHTATQQGQTIIGAIRQ